MTESTNGKLLYADAAETRLGEIGETDTLGILHFNIEITRALAEGQLSPQDYIALATNLGNKALEARNWEMRHVNDPEGVQNQLNASQLGDLAQQLTEHLFQISMENLRRETK